MQIQISSPGVEVGSRARRAAQERIRLVLGRYGDRIAGVDVNFADQNGPKGGVDIRCRIEVEVAHVGRIVADAREEDASNAFARALERVSRAVRRTLRRRRDLTRR